MYRPLPECLTIKASEINGLGLFATKDIDKDTVLGLTHVKVKSQMIRTPLGGFYNHSDDPNCEKIHNIEIGTPLGFSLKTLRKIKAGEELTVKYTLYQVKE